MKEKIRQEVLKVYNQELDVNTVVDNILLLIDDENYDITLDQSKSRGCCPECGEGYDNEEEWIYNTECEICEHPIPEHLIVKRP